ncbi:MAG: triple tyrosine motif-containing protein [Bacteroidota bacterium]
MKIRTMVLFASLFACQALFAQEGNFLLTHHIPRALGLDHTNFDVVYDKNGLVNVANRKGILRYDGHSWDLVYTPMAVFALAEGPDGTLYAAGEGDFGKVAYAESGEFLYQSLRSEAGNIPKAWFDVQVLGGKVYFLSLDEVVVYDPYAEENPLQPLMQESFYYRTMFKEPGRLLIETEGSGTILVSEDAMALDSAGFLPDTLGDLTIAVHNRLNGQAIYGTHTGLWKFKDDQWVAAFPDLDSLLEESWLLNAQWVQDTLLAVGTLNQGVLFLNPQQGTLVQHINYHTGLPDNEVLALEVDEDYGVWVAHEFGFSRISPGLPIRSFAHYPGLEGNLLSVKRHQGQLYVATSLGVFYLDQINNYRETVYYVRKRNAPVPAPTRTRPLAQPAPQPQADQGEEPRRNFFGNLFSRQAREERKAQREQQRIERQAAREQRQQEAEEEGGFLKRLFGEEEEEQPQYRYERRVRRELISIRYVFKKVEGIDAKCKQLVTFGDKLLVGSHSGVYEVSEGNALLISDQPVQYLYPTRDTSNLVLSTLYDEIILLQQREELWLERPLNDQLLEPIIHINEDDQYLWLVSPDHVLKYDWQDTTHTFHSYPIRNPNYEPLFAVNIDGAMHFVNGEAYHRFDASLDSIVMDEEMMETYGTPLDYHYSSPDQMWVYNGKQWIEITADNPEEVNLDYLLLFEQIQHLSIDETNGNLWVTTPQEEMYQYDNQDSTSLAPIHELVLKGVHGQGGSWLPLNDFVINKEASFVQFEFTRPDFLGKLDIEYRYRLKGLNSDWSPWDDQSTITFNFLPPGSYTLEVQARDAFGNENRPYSVDFSVVPPWWEQPWFYFVEVSFFTFFLLISFRINRTRMRRTILSRVLTYLTLILVIEFLQNLTKTQLTLGGNPIVEFGLEAAIAFALLPLEGLLRKLMVASGKNAKTEASPTA